MTAGHGSSVEPITDAERAQVTPEVLASIGKMVDAANVDRSYDIRGVANRSIDGKTLLIDRKLPHTMDAGDKFDPADTLVWHEIPEWFLMHKLGLAYEPAHSMATELFERPKVQSMGLDWPKYQEAFGSEIAANNKRAMDKFCPDIDREPYEQDGDERALHEIAGARRAAKLLPVHHDPWKEEPPVHGAAKAEDGEWYAKDPRPSRRDNWLRIEGHRGRR